MFATEENCDQASDGGNAVAQKRIDVAHKKLGKYTTLDRYQSTTTTNFVVTATVGYDTANRLASLTGPLFLGQLSQEPQRLVEFRRLATTDAAFTIAARQQD